MRAERIPLYRSEEPLQVDEPYVLVTPTYGGGDGNGAVPKQVIRFLNDERNRRGIRGVISAGNTNFGEGFCIAGGCHEPQVRRAAPVSAQLFGTADDVARVSDGLESWWKRQQ